MDHALARELKDAGFPQLPLNRVRPLGSSDCVTGGRAFYEDGEFIFLPTLEELIEACEERFGSVIRLGSYFQATDAYAHSRDYVAADFASYATPREAVARLWLALNKPKEQRH